MCNNDNNLVNYLQDFFLEFMGYMQKNNTQIPGNQYCIEYMSNEIFGR